MPLYTDANYYYSGGSSQLYSPYYPGSSSTIPTSSNIYTPYLSTYNRSIGGSYAVPISTTRTPSFTSSHGLSSSRYQPKLSTITESSPLIGSTRHKPLIPLTRIQSPKYINYSTSAPIHTPKYIPPRPILINTADIDVSANRYRKRKEETLRQTQRGTDYTSPNSSIKRRNSAERKEEEEQKLRNEFASRQTVSETPKDSTPEKHINRSTIKRDRAIVRLSTIRSRSKDRNENKNNDSTPSEAENLFKDLPTYQMPAEVHLKWREKLAEDLIEMPSNTSKKSPGDLLREKYLIQDSTNTEDSAAQRQHQKMIAGLPKETIEEVIVEIDPLHHTVRRLSMPQYPTFHDICEDISSDKIDDDLNAGELRRRASVIQCQEQEILNELQKSSSGTFQMITMERRANHDSGDDMPTKRHSKRSSKKGKKIRTKITAIVDIENASPTSTIGQDTEETLKSPQPNYTVNVESVEEHQEIHTVFKLPKKKSIKRMPKIREQVLPEGFMSSLPKPESSPKKKLLKSTRELFSFDENLIRKTNQEPILKKDVETSATVVKTENEKEAADTKRKDVSMRKTSQSLDLEEKSSPSKSLKQSSSTNNDIITSASPKVPTKNEKTFKPLEKSSSLNMELISPATSKDVPLKKVVPLPMIKNEVLVIPLEKPNTLNIDIKTPPSLKGKLDVAQEPLIPSKPIKQHQKLEDIKPLNKTAKSSPPMGSIPKCEANKISAKPIASEEELAISVQKDKTIQMKNIKQVSQIKKPLEKLNSTGTELKLLKNTKTIKAEAVETKTATPKPIKNAIVKSDSGEDFWAQIGTRESFYMNNRKKDIMEYQWKKGEELFGSTTEEEVKNVQEIKNLVTSQRIDALTKTDEDQKNSKEIVSQSATNESALKKKSQVTCKEEGKAQKVLQSREKAFPLQEEYSINKNDDAAKTLLTPKNSKSIDYKIETNDKLETTKMSEETSLLSPSTITNTFASTTTSHITTSLKIIGQQSKSPEQQETGEQNKFHPKAAAKSNINKNEINMNKTTITTEKQLLANTLTLPAEKTKITSATSAHDAAAEAKTTKQPETKEVSKILNKTDIKKAPAKPKTADTNKKPLPVKNEQTDKQANNKPQTKVSPNALNADQFVPKAPAKINTPTAKTALKPSAPVKALITTSSNNVPTTQTIDKQKTTIPTSTKQTNDTDTATTTSNTAAAKADDRQEICDTSKDTNSVDANTNTNSKSNGDEGTCGGNLSKFATVSNLAQCLHDVDADLADFLPSSAEISDNEDYKTDDSDFDYSSIDGWDKLTPSMKKKVKQRRRKEKQAEQPRFDPQKKVKIDTARKLYVKDEAPRFPLVATPRPLWKREKIVYPDEDSDEDSDSEESGSTEETEDSDECTTSEEYEDETNASPSGVVSNAKSDSGISGGDGGGGVSEAIKQSSSIIRMSTCSNDSGFEGGTAPSSPKKMLECDVNCHKKCERLTANLCGVNQKLIVEALANVKRGARESRDSPSTPPSSNPVYNIDAIEEQGETSYTYSQFQKSGRFTPPATIIPRFKNYTVDDFHFLAVLGKGSFGKVLLAELRDTTYYYAVKCLKKDVVLEDDDVDSTLIERKVLALGTKHPYLCHLFCTFQTESHLFFVMEYLNGGDLMFHIQESGRFTEERARFYGAEIVSGLKFLHKKGIIYRDLKLDNVLLDYEGHVRIADFGMCKLQIYLDKTADSFCGTPDYMAPEIIKGDKYNQNVDWWSFGVLLYEMLIGQSPFSGCDEDELFWSICNELPWFPVYISAEATSILKGLLEKDFTKRIGSHYSPAGDIVEHIFFRPIDWNLLEKRQIVPPFRPQVKHPLDTQYFDRVFTRERVRLTPIDKDILQSMDQKQFLGFTYTNPHITLD